MGNRKSVEINGKHTFAHLERSIWGQLPAVHLESMGDQSELGLPSDVLSETAIHILIATVTQVAQP